MTASQLLNHKWLAQMMALLPDGEHKKRIQNFVKLLAGLVYGNGINL